MEKNELEKWTRSENKRSHLVEWLLLSSYFHYAHQKEKQRRGWKYGKAKRRRRGSKESIGGDE